MTNKELVKNMMEVIAVCELDKENVRLDEANYLNQRVLISSLFTGRYNIGQIILRLTVIDSLYSTNASYSYFSFDEMARRIYALGDDAGGEDGKRRLAQEYFYKVATTGEDEKGLFSKNYGIQKNLSDGSKQMSLMSKYAYYELMQDPKSYPLGFPIYDRLAKNAYPTVCRMLGLDSYWSMPSLETPSIKLYTACISQLRNAIFEDDILFMGKYQQFDILDAYLWRMGKFSDGNLSLLLGLDEYKTFVSNMNLDIKKEESQEQYDERMLKEYKEIKGNDNKNYNFNEIVRFRLAKDDTAFYGLQNESYMLALLKHWRMFVSCDDMAPRRGTKFLE